MRVAVAAPGVGIVTTLGTGLTGAAGVSGTSFAAPIVTGAADKGTFVRIASPMVEGRVVRGHQGLDVGDTLRVRLLSVEAQKVPQPAVNIRGDKVTKYRHVSDVVNIAQAQGMRKVGFVATRERN